MADTRPLWSRAETILALDVAVALRRHVDERDVTVVDLSRLLRSTDRDPPPRQRNPHGVACKVNRLVALIGGEPRRGGARLEAAVCREFAGRPAALAAAVAEARSTLGAMRHVEPSRGPVPAFGAFATTRADGETWVYLARLGGACLADGRLLAKVGRSADVSRRMAELNGGLPAPLGMRWRTLATWRYADAAAAHAAEQAMLARYGRAGWSVGGEFLAVEAGDLAGIAVSGPGVTGRSVRPPSPSGRSRRGSRRARSRYRAPRSD